MTSEEGELGALERYGAGVTLRFARLLPHAPATVWRALTEPDHLAAWFPAAVEGDLKVGSRLTFSFPEMNVPVFEGTVLAFEPPRLFELVWGDEQLRFVLTEHSAGTLLTFTASFAELGRAARDGAGWHVCLDLLAFEISGQAAPWSSDDRWREVHRQYVASFGEEAATIGPPPEWQDAHPVEQS